jgi:soluble lytic murein transglycosylase-like protein
MLVFAVAVGWAAMPSAWRHGVEGRALVWLKARHVQRGETTAAPASVVAWGQEKPPSVMVQPAVESSPPLQVPAQEQVQEQVLVQVAIAASSPEGTVAPRSADGGVDEPDAPVGDPVFMAEPEPASSSDDTDTAREAPVLAEDSASDPANPTVTQVEVASWVPAIPLAVLSKEQAAVAKWLSSRYRVAKEPIARLVHEAWEAGLSAGLDPTLVLAVAAIESRFNPFAQSPMGAQGLMQVVTRVHQEKFEPFGGNQAAFDPVANLRVGSQILKDLINRRGGVEEGLRAYVGATTTSGEGYTRKVLAERDYMSRVMKGHRVSPHIVARTEAARPAAPKPAESAAAPQPSPPTNAATVLAAEDRAVATPGSTP